MRNPKALARRLITPVKPTFYFIMEEFKVPAGKAIIPADVADVNVVTLRRDEMALLGDHPERDAPTEMLVRWYDEGRRCLALNCGGEIAAYSWYALDHFDFLGRKFKLEPDQAYLFNARTYVAFRGKNLAPYLRNELMTLLARQGVQRHFSITLASNKSSRRFKQKLGAKPVELGVRLRFYRFQRNFCLRRFDSSGPREIR